MGSLTIVCFYDRFNTFIPAPRFDQYHGTPLILFAVGGSFLTFSANVIIYFIPREATGVVSATYSTMRIIGGAIGSVIAGVFLSIYSVEIQDPLHAGEMLAIPDSTAFNITFLVGALASLSMIPMIIISGAERFQ